MIKEKYFFWVFWVFLVLLFFSPIFLGKIPAPLDTIVGLYHPWRDQVWNNLTAGVPYKNFLITDPVRQQIPWRYLAIEQLKKGNLFSWNPYSFAGTPLTVNSQTALFYPFNILFFILPFITAWTLNIVISLWLAGIFLYLYLRNFKLKKTSSFLGALAFSFSGFFIAWLEWGTITNVLLWLPLILLAQEKLFKKFTFFWFFILLLAEFSQLMGGHLQVSFYVFTFSIIYLFVRIPEWSLKKFFLFIILLVILLPLVSIQYYPFLKFLKFSARNFDLPDFQTSSWFLPLRQTVQFLVPDFFGNPSTLNYWGEWNYGEFIGYIGVVPLIFSLAAVFLRADKRSRFFSLWVLIIFVLILRNPVSELPYLLKIPFISTAQPTRLISLLVFCLSVLSALGLDLFIEDKKEKVKKKIIAFNLLLLIFIIMLWLIVLLANNFFSKETANKLLTVTGRNLVIPSVLVLMSLLLLKTYHKTQKQIIIFFLLIMTVIDLFRFGRKFLSFSDPNWFYPLTKTTSFLKSQREPFRFMTVDRRLFPPNFSVMYKLEDVAGYDPLYLLSYAKLVQSWNSNKPNIIPGKFNRIITPQNYDSFIADLLNVRYVLSLKELNSPKLVLRFIEGETRVYENLKVYPRIFFVEKVKVANSEEEEIKLMFEESDNLRFVAVSQERVDFDQGFLEENEKAEIIERSENYLKIKSVTNKKRLLVLSEVNYPAWNVYIDGKKSRVHTLDLLLRGVVVPEGVHIIEFKYLEI